MAGLKRLLPRFSLRTLVIAPLLATCVFAVWWRWEPWVFEQALEGEAKDMAFSPDGRLLAAAGMVAGGPVLSIYRLSDGSRRDLPTGSEMKFTGLLSFSPDGRHLLTTWYGHDPTVWDVEAGHVVFALKGYVGRVRHASYSPDGRSIVTGDYASWLRLWEAEAGNLLAEQHVGGAVDVARFSRDGRRVLSVTSRSLQVWDSRLTERLFRKVAPARGLPPEATVDISPDGSRVAYGDDAGGVHVDAIDGEGEGSGLVLGGHEDYALCVRFFPDNELLLTCDGIGTASTWYHNGVKASAVTAHILSAFLHSDAIWLSDGRRIAGTWDVGILIFDATVGRVLAIVSPSYEREVFLRSSAISCDGRRIAMTERGDKFITVFRRRRPEWWWGVFYLWEFWLTAAFACLFIWSVITDRRPLARTG